MNIPKRFTRLAESGLYVPDNTIIMPSMGVSGHFKMEAVSFARGRRKLAEFDNLILDQGIEFLGTSGVGGGFAIQLGTGSTTPATTQTSLAALAVGTTNSTGSLETYSAGAPSYMEAAFTFRFNAGIAVGTFSEIGIAKTVSTGLFCRALILDVGGSPTTITVLSDEALDVTYKFRIYPTLTDNTGTLTLSGVGYTYTMRPAFWGLISGGAWSPRGFLTSGANTTISQGNMANGASLALGAVTSILTGSTSSGVFGSSVANAYTTSSNFRTYTITTGLTQGNATGGVKGMYWSFGGSAMYQVLFGSVIPKDSTKVMTHSCRLSWARRP